MIGPRTSKDDLSSPTDFARKFRLFVNNSREFKGLEIQRRARISNEENEDHINDGTEEDSGEMPGGLLDLAPSVKDDPFSGGGDSRYGKRKIPVDIESHSERVTSSPPPKMPCFDDEFYSDSDSLEDDNMVNVSGLNATEADETPHSDNLDDPQHFKDSYFEEGDMLTFPHPWFFQRNGSSDFPKSCCSTKWKF